MMLLCSFVGRYFLRKQGYLWELVCIHLYRRQARRVNRGRLQKIIKYDLMIFVKCTEKVEKEECLLVLKRKETS